MRQARKYVAIATGVCLLLAAGLLVAAWRSDAGGLKPLKDMLLNIGG
jgi:hypothetical protein